MKSKKKIIEPPKKVSAINLPKPYIRQDFFTPKQIEEAQSRIDNQTKKFATPASGRIEGEGLIDALLPIAAAPLIKAVAKPIAKIAGDAASYATTKTPLKDAYKINPYAFRPDKTKWYRQVGKEAIDDAANTKLIREAGEEVSPKMLRFFEEQLERMKGTGMESRVAGRRPISPFFSKGDLFYPMGRKPIITKSGKISKNPAGKGDADYLIETNLPNESFQPAYVKGMQLGVPKEIGQTAILKPDPNLRNIENFKLYQKNWLKGYKPMKSSPKK